MMSCFCYVPASLLRNRFSMGLTPVLPAPPSLKLAVALPALDPAERADVQIDAGFEPVRLPNIDLGGGPLAQMALSLNMAMGTFKIDDLPMLEFQMDQAAKTFHKNIWPRLGFLTSFKIQPLLNFALVARLVLDLRALGIDPMEMKAGDIPMASGSSNYRFRLSPPKLAMAKLAAGLPNLLKLDETLNIPPLGDPEHVTQMRNRLNALSTLSPPTLQIPFKMILKLAMVLEALAKIQEAFGDDPFSPASRGRINAMLRFFARLNIPIPMPALALKAKLEVLPPMEDIKLGERMAGSSGLSTLSRFSPPKLAISPFLNVMLALHAAFNITLDVDPESGTCSCGAAL
ncbi:MAG: hypothetical protein AAF557_18825 [Pseudomonadota bacterium]